MKNKTSFLTILVFFIFFTPFFVFADGGMIVWPPRVHLDQTAQNAIVAWNGEEEIIILSNDIESDAEATALRMVPLPSNPSEIKEGNFESFGKITEIMNKKIDNIRNQWMAAGKDIEGTPTPGVEITFHEKIGAHDVTVVKVNDLDYFLNWIKDFADSKGLEIKEISSEFKNGISNYLKRDIKYFVFDVINTKETKESIKPLIYKFDTDYLYYPLLITGVSEIGESRAKIHVFLITKDSISEIPFRWNLGYSEVELTHEELNEISEEIAGLFNYDSVSKVRKFNSYDYFRNIEKDIIVYPQIWKGHLDIGSQGEDVKALQKILINEGVWNSNIGATGYFGSITKNALANFQDKYNYEILKPIGLEKGTGYFGSKTIEYLEKSSIKVSPKEEIPNELYCEQDSDCVGAVCCHADSCVNVGSAPDCVGAICTQIFAECTLDNGVNKCKCVENRCTFVLGEEYKSICQKEITTWSRNLFLGARGDDVKKLQEILIREEVWQRPDIEPTGYFGSITRAAVIRFQEKYASEILEPLELFKGTGFVGLSTRAYLENIEK